MPSALAKMAIIGEQANLDVFVLMRDRRKHRYVGEQNNRGPWPRYYVYAAGEEVAEEGERLGPGLAAFQSELTAAKNTHVRNDERGAYQLGLVYSKTFTKDIGRPPKGSRAELRRKIGTRVQWANEEQVMVIPEANEEDKANEEDQVDETDQADEAGQADEADQVDEAGQADEAHEVDEAHEADQAVVPPPPRRKTAAEIQKEKDMMALEATLAMELPPYEED